MKGTSREFLKFGSVFFKPGISGLPERSKLSEIRISRTAESYEK
jgi:hypothetical protein